jgi:hypothetical protein
MRSAFPSLADVFRHPFRDFEDPRAVNARVIDGLLGR